MHKRLTIKFNMQQRGTETTGNMLLTVTSLKQHAGNMLCGTETKGNKWNWIKCYKLGKIAKLIKPA